MKLEEPDRELFLAIRETTYYRLFESPEGQFLMDQENIHLIVFDADQKEVLKWIA